VEIVNGEQQTSDFTLDLLFPCA